VHTLNRDILGIHKFDTVNRVVKLRFGDIDLKWCEGRIPVPNGEIALRWDMDDKQLRYRLSVPTGYRVVTENQSGRELVRAE
jgi:hypothetical protein